MAKKISSTLYDITREMGKVASKIRDFEVLLSGDPQKILKRMYNKNLYKASNKLTRKLRAK